MAERLLFEMLVIVAASFAAVALLARRRFSPIVGYLAVGVLIGPHGFNLLPATEGVRFLGELGVAFLMFIVGLDFSLPRMIAARGVVFGLGGLQVALSRQPEWGREVAYTWLCSGCCGRAPPLLGRIGTEGAKCTAGDEVAIKVEGVVDSGVSREKALG